MPNGNLPASRIRWRSPDSVDTAASRRDQRRPDTALLQNLRHPVDRISFSDSAWIEFHARPSEPYASVSRVQLYLAKPNQGQGRPDFRTMRKASATLIKSPHLHQR